MEPNTLTVSQLIEATRAELLRSRYTELSLKTFEVVWRNLQEYVESRNVEYFSRDIGIEFLAHRYRITATAQHLSGTDQDRLRAIDLLADYQAHARILIRRQRKQPDLASPFQSIVEAFLNHQKQAGRSARTLQSHDIYLRRLAAYLDEHGVQRMSNLDAPCVAGFLRATAAQYRIATVYCTASLLRVFLRYLYTQGEIARDLSVFVPPVRCDKQAKVPSAYASDEIKRLLDAVDRANPKGKRDYAILLLAARLGLRASAICELTFDHLRWESNTIALAQPKTEKSVVLPLLNEVGEAIIEYLKYGRPPVDTDVVFLRHTAPPGPLQPPTLHSIVTQYLRRAGITIPEGKKHGPHALRHSLASAMLRNETPLPVISEVLGHTNSDTTRVYLKIDIGQLRTYALPVPPLRSVWWGGDLS